jgi:hypothetical protein
VRGFCGVIAGVGANATVVVLGSFLGEETEGAVTGSFELAVRHREEKV